LQRGKLVVPSQEAMSPSETRARKETVMLSSASLAGAVAGILVVAATAAHMLIDFAFRFIG